MLPPVLEIYVAFHPDDTQGSVIAADVFDHFHGTTFTGLIGGAIEVYVRSDNWFSSDNAPRPIPVPGASLPNGIAPAHLTAVVPILSLELADAVERGNGWYRFIEDTVAASRSQPDRVGIFPFLLPATAIDGTKLASLVGTVQRLAVPAQGAEPEPRKELLLRDLVQGITQLILGTDSRLTVFISHTTQSPQGGHEDVVGLIKLVREVIAETRLRSFFAASDLQPGRDFEEALRSAAATSAMLALRTDLYASREWCQREMLTAKRSGMPIVILDSLGVGEERGSFLMDHLPRLPVRPSGSEWAKEDIRRGLNLLVDECLKRAVWNVQKTLGAGRSELNVAWWAPHAPEPVTLTQWIVEASQDGRFSLGNAPLRVLHPDPPLGPDEVHALTQILTIAGHSGAFDVMTPRGLAARGA